MSCSYQTKYILFFSNIASYESIAHAPLRYSDIILTEAGSILVFKAKNLFLSRCCRGTQSGTKLTIEFSNRKESTFLQSKGLFCLQCNCSWDRWTNNWPSDILNYVSLMARSSFQLILHLVDGLKCTLICIVPQVWHYLCRASQVDSIFFLLTGTVLFSIKAYGYL